MELWWESQGAGWSPQRGPDRALGSRPQTRPPGFPRDGTVTLKFSSVSPSSVLASLIIAATYRFTRFLMTSCGVGKTEGTLRPACAHVLESALTRGLPLRLAQAARGSGGRTYLVLVMSPQVVCGTPLQRKDRGEPRPTDAVPSWKVTCPSPKGEADESASQGPEQRRVRWQWARRSIHAGETRPQTPAREAAGGFLTHPQRSLHGGELGTGADTHPKSLEMMLRDTDGTYQVKN